MGTIQLKDFYNAENNLNGKEYSFISQNDKTRKVTLDKLKEFIIGTGTLLTSDQSNIINAINEIQQSVLSQSGGTGVLQTDIDKIKTDYVSKTTDLLKTYTVGTTGVNLIPTVQALTDVYNLLNGLIITINKNIGDRTKLATNDNSNLVNAINEINNLMINLQTAGQELETLIGGTFDTSVEGTLVEQIKNIRDTININKSVWEDKYTKAEVDNKVNLLIINTAWKDSVATFADLNTTYPNAQDGWTVFVQDTGFTYRHSNGAWVQISSYNLPLATASHDGRMSKEDKAYLDNIKSTNQSQWDSAVTHIGDTVKHITSAERTLWNTVSDKSDKTHNHNGIYYTESEIDNKVSTLNTSISGKSDLNHTHTKSDITDFPKLPTKLSELTNDAGYITSADVDTSQNHTHSNKTILDGITSAKVTKWNTVSNKADKTHTHKISDITDMPTKLSQFTNDAGYITKSDTSISTFNVASEYSPNVYKVTTGQSLTSLKDGYSVRVAIPTNSSGAVSVMVDGITVPVTLSDGSAITDFKAGGVYNLTYYNGNFICASGGKSLDTVTFTSDKLLTGYTANDSDGKAINGTMPNNGSPMITLNCGGTYNLSAGYYGGGTISANSLASQTSATATADKILSGQTAYVNGNKVTGTMANKGAYAQVTSWSPYNSKLFFRFPAGYYSGGNFDGDNQGGAECAIPFSDITTALGITADKIVAGNTILGVTGTATVQSMGSKKYASGTIKIICTGMDNFTSDNYFLGSAHIELGFKPTSFTLYGYWDSYTNRKDVRTLSEIYDDHYPLNSKGGDYEFRVGANITDNGLDVSNSYQSRTIEEGQQYTTTLKYVAIG